MEEKEERKKEKREVVTRSIPEDHLWQSHHTASHASPCGRAVKGRERLQVRGNAGLR